MRGVLASIVGLLLVRGTVCGDDAAHLTFEQHIRPILKAHCFHCHGEESELGGNLDVRLVRLLMAGGESESAIVPGDATSSLLWQRIESDEMPEGPKKLSDPQKAVIRLWIEQGAKTARPEPDDVRDARFSLEELSHWAFQPVQRPEIPRPPSYELQTPIDGFIAERLAEHDLRFSPVADRRTLIRRVTFGLLGLPPPPQEVERFVADESPDAYGKLVERLLASPQFGVRWGRHWLDVAGFAETDGGPDSDTARPHAWRYRDYVIDAFNSGKSVDQFYLEQLAGDELLEGEIDIHDRRHRELLTATGFMRMAPDPTQSRNTLADRNMATADALQVISSAMLGVTVACAQCHDHKYDPITIDDYYRFRAVFDPVFPLQNWQLPNVRLTDFTPKESVVQAKKIEAQAKVLEDDLRRRRDELGKRIQELKLADVPAEDRDATRKAVLTEPGKRTEEQQRLLDLYPMVKPVSNIVGLLIEYDMPAYRKFEQESKRIAAIRAKKPPKQMVMVVRERPDVVPVSQVFFRGNPATPGKVVAPGELMVLSRDRQVHLPQNEPSLATTGRRLAYARQLTDGTHPLTARVFVNRVWFHHIGRGLVPTPSDFGVSGERPSHPKLLDWLADDLVRHGWDPKRLHRMILLSRTYQQVSRRTPRLDSVDPENALLARMNLRRLEAEAIRDAILSVVGQLDQQIGGPSVPVVENPEGKVVIGRATVRDGLKTGVDDTNATASRRSVYIQVQRRLPLNMLATFDQPDMTPNCDLRRPSTVATQALWFLNDRIIVKQSERLAHRLEEDATESHRQIEALFLLLFAQPPTEEEMNACLEFLATQRRYFEGQTIDDAEGKGVAADPALRAMATLSQTLLASNRFLYVD